MTPRVLIVGADGRGSFEVRGRQLGAAIGARVTTQPKAGDWLWADVVVLVKRAALEWGQTAVHTRMPIVWDVLDYWRQPNENSMPVEELRQRILGLRDSLGITTTIGATQSMADAIGGVYLPHHSRPGLAPAPPRTGGTLIVGYEGQAKYLGTWRRALEQACARLEMVFVVNPSDLRAVDVVVALRGESWDGEVCREWKSPVKFVNALVSGRPVLTQPCAGFDEVSPVGLAIDSPDSLVGSLRILSSLSCRQDAYEMAVRRRQEFHLKTTAARYHDILVNAAARVAA